MKKFNVGDRVYYDGEGNPEYADYGIVTGEDPDGKIWVKWESNGHSEWAWPSMIVLVGAKEERIRAQERIRALENDNKILKERLDRIEDFLRNLSFADNP